MINYLLANIENINLITAYKASFSDDRISNFPSLVNINFLLIVVATGYQPTVHHYIHPDGIRHVMYYLSSISIIH
jgi:hypothetical protein